MLYHYILWIASYKSRESQTFASITIALYASPKSILDKTESNLQRTGFSPVSQNDCNDSTMNLFDNQQRYNKLRLEKLGIFSVRAAFINMIHLR